MYNRQTSTWPRQGGGAYYGRQQGSGGNSQGMTNCNAMNNTVAVLTAGGAVPSKEAIADMFTFLSDLLSGAGPAINGGQ